MPIALVFLRVTSIFRRVDAIGGDGFSWPICIFVSLARWLWSRDHWEVIRASSSNMAGMVTEWYDPLIIFKVANASIDLCDIAKVWDLSPQWLEGGTLMSLVGVAKLKLGNRWWHVLEVDNVVRWLSIKASVVCLEAWMSIGMQLYSQFNWVISPSQNENEDEKQLGDVLS